MTAPAFALALSVSIDSITLPLDVSDHITSVTVTHELNTMDSFQLTIANPYPALPWTSAEGDALFHEGNQVAVAMGYVGEVPSMITGPITGVSAQFPDGGGPAVVISGNNRLYALSSNAGGHHFNNTTDAQMVKEIAIASDLEPLVTPTLIRYSDVLQGSQTDLDFLVQRATRIDYEVTAVGRKLIFRPHQADGPSAYTFVWGHPADAIGLLGGVVPLKRFDVKLSLVGQASSVSLTSTNPLGGPLIAATAGEEAEPDVQPQKITDQPVGSLQEAAVLARAAFNQKRRKLVTASGATIGLPSLRPGQLIDVQGVGRFSGRYYVTQTTHTIGEGGYETTFSAEKEPLP
jgi:phage protein D